MNEMSPQISRFAAVGLLLVLILAVVFYGIVPLVKSYNDRGDEVAMLGKRLATLQNLLANGPIIDEEIQRLDSLNTSGDVFLEGRKVAIASAKLREFIDNIVKDSGGVLVSTQEYEVEPLDTASAVGLRVQFKGEVDNFSNLLYRLESARPLVFIDKMTITSSAARKTIRRNIVRRARAKRGRSRSSRLSLTVRMNVFGYMVAGDL